MNKTKTVEALKALKMDGLANTRIGCGCGVDDLIPCVDEHSGDCRPGYKWECAKCVDSATCDNFTWPYGHQEACCYQLIPQEKVSDHCRRTGRRNCHICEDTRCGDNLKR